MAASDEPTFCHGLCYPKYFLSGLDTIQNRFYPFPPIYAITAAQYADLKYAYSLADVDESVLFPFLYGRGAPFGRGTVPRYRGLMSVVCPTSDEDHMAFSPSSRLLSSILPEELISPIVRVPEFVRPSKPSGLGM